MRAPTKGSKKVFATERRRVHEMPVGAPRAPLPTFLEPSLALLVDKPPGGPRWVHEIKFDGYRIQVRIDGDDIRLLTRKALDWTKRFPTIAAALRGLDTGKAVLDGEIVSEDERGKISNLNFQVAGKQGLEERGCQTK